MVAQQDQPAEEFDRTLVHHFIRRVGRRADVGDQQRARPRVSFRRPGRVRRGAARLISRL